jgi:hypothetical protein
LLLNRNTGSDSNFSVHPLQISVKTTEVPLSEFLFARGAMFRKLFEKKAQGLTGAPAVRRLKTYSAESGYVYQYSYKGQRPHTTGTEFVFTISADRKTWHDLSVVVTDDAVRSWEGAHARRLSSTERYAVAKMALFAALDERASPAEMQEPVFVGDAGVAGAAERLGLD